MAIESKIVFEWEINNPDTVLASGQPQSQKWTKEGFEWAVKIERSTHRSWTVFSITCNENHRGPWFCDAMVSYTAHRTGGTWREPYRSRTKFTEDDNLWTMESGIMWMYNVNGKLTLKICIDIFSSSGGILGREIDTLPIIDSVYLTKFISPIETSNETLLIGEKKLVVSKEYLAMHSPVFATTFFGNFEENGKAEVELKEIDYDEFVHLLLVIFPDLVRITDATVLSIAKLADRFQMQGVLNAVENHLLSSHNFNDAKKLQLSDDYRFNKLTDACLQNFKNIQELKVFKDSPLFGNFSDHLKARICEKMVQLL